jgi:3-hydroxybutyryl-CoA dehydratase
MPNTIQKPIVDTKTEDRTPVGLDCGSRSYTVDRPMVDKLVGALREPHPYYEGPTPFGGPVAPALLFHSEVYVDRRWYLPNLHGFLHARQEFENFAPIFLDEKVTTHTMVAERYAKRDREYVVCESLVLGNDGRICSRGRTHQSFLKPEVISATTVKGSTRSARSFAVGQGEYLECLDPIEKTIDLDMCDRFSGPRLSLHNDITEAKKYGFERVLVQGMLSICLVSEMMTRRFAAGWLQGGKMTVNLVNPVWEGETIRVCGRVKSRVKEGARDRASLEVWCEKSDGTVVLVGNASACE